MATNEERRIRRSGRDRRGTGALDGSIASREEGGQRLRSAVQHSLALRVIVSAVIISLLFAALTWFGLQDEVGDDVLRHVLYHAKRFSASSRNLLDERGMSDPAAAQLALDEYVARQPPPDWGHFVVIRLYNLDGSVVADYPKGSGEGLAEIRERLERFHGAGSGRRHELARFGSGVAVLIEAPLLDTGERTVGSIEGAFLLASETLTAGRHKVIRNVFYVIAIVLATALALYPIVMDLVRRLARASSDLLQANLETIQILGDAVAKRDQETQAHSCRVTIYAVRLAEAEALSAAAVRRLIKGAFLHDVGKVAISDTILLKPGKLSTEEFEVMKTHVVHGEDIVRRCAWLDDARDVVRSHHERYDGNGYMHGLAGEDIPLAARIFAVADVFDALTSQRPYHEARSLDATLEALREGRGSHFDPRLVDVFSGIAPELYEQVAGREIEDLRQDLAAIVQDYYTGGLEALET